MESAITMNSTFLACFGVALKIYLPCVFFCFFDFFSIDVFI